MAKTLLSTLGALALATSLGAQQPTPATQPVRPPDRPPSGEPAPPLRAPEPDSRRPAERGSGDGESREAGEPEAGTLTLKGCLQRVASPQAFRLHPVEGDDATVTEDVRLGGDVEQLRDHVGRIVEVRGTLRAGHAGHDDAGVVQRDSREGRSRARVRRNERVVRRGGAVDAGASASASGRRDRCSGRGGTMCRGLTPR